MSMLEEMQDYYWTMAARERLIMIDEGWTALCTFFILDSELEIPDFYDRKCWTMPQDHTEGTIAYIDKIIARVFTRSILREIERALVERFPTLEQAVWYRPGRDVDYRYTYRRRYDVSYQV